MKFYTGAAWPVVVFKTGRGEFVAVVVEKEHGYDATTIRAMSLKGWRGGRLHRTIPPAVDRIVRPQVLAKGRLTA